MAHPSSCPSEPLIPARRFFPPGASTMHLHLTRSWSARMAAGAMAVGAITGVSACSSSEPTGSSASQATGQHMTASDFSTAIAKPGTIVLDVRTPAEYASGHLPQAQNIDIEAADFATRITTLDKNATYAIYCRSGNRSGVALEQMAGAGFTHLYDLAGGRVSEVRNAAAGRTVSVHCASGVRSYLATRVLLGEGFDARNLSGGWLTLRAVHPNL